MHVGAIPPEAANFSINPIKWRVSKPVRYIIPSICSSYGVVLHHEIINSDKMFIVQGIPRTKEIKYFEHAKLEFD